MHIVVLAAAVVITIANSIGFLSGLWGTRPGEVYLGTTHYWEDYFFYLSQFFQGAHGGWLTVNRYTSEPTTPSILFWPNVILGKLGGLVGLSPEISYNVSVMLLSFAVLLTIASIMRHAFPTSTKALVGFLFAATATSFMNHIWVDGKPMWYPFQLWKTPNFALDRLGSVPHQIVQTLLFLLVMHVYFFYRPKKSPALLSLLLLLFLLVLLSTLNPVMSALFVFAMWMTYLLTQSPRASSIISPVAASVTVAIATWYYTIISNREPHVQSKLWEASQQIATTPLFMLLSVGPISLVGIAGAWAAIKHARPAYIFSVVLLAAAYLLYFSPIPMYVGISNSRVLFPAMYAAWGILGVLGMEAITKTKKVLIFLAFLFFLVSLPALTWEIEQKLLVKPEERTPLLYLPNDVYHAFVYVRNLGTYDDIVLANPARHMDAMVPALASHTGYTGHPFATLHSDAKRAEASRFFRRQMTADEARQWLRERQIRYVLITKFDGDTNQLLQAYPFFRVLFSTGSATVLESS